MIDGMLAHVTVIDGMVVCHKTIAMKSIKW